MNFQITTPEYYDHTTSLAQDIDFLSDSKNSISDQRIANMIMKFILCYFYIGEIHTKISFDELVHFFNTINAIASDTTISLSEIHKRYEQCQLNGIYHIQDYPIRMACDIASTTQLVKDIISRKLITEAFDGNYVGMDLGSGIGILTVANGIQARRNGFNKITNTGFEIGNITSEYSNILINALELGKVVHQDTTKKSLFHHIPQYEDITFISNETLCDPGVAFNKVTFKSDPFIENNQNIFSHGKIFLNKHTGFFPEQVKTLNTHTSQSCILNKDNQFTHPDVFDICSDPHILTDISICGEFKSLEHTGQDLQKKGVIYQPPNMTPRWSSKRHEIKAEEDSI